MPPIIQNFRYRPEIDGLRAIAVLAVVFFHAGIGMPGGFIGVDVFFVISGYLITSLIIKDLQTDTFSLASFWERRARRIFPAAAAMVLIVLVAGWFLLLPTDYSTLAKAAAWQAVFAANFYFWKTTNYFSGPADEQPLLHTWSLAVEEQFYLFVPLILIALFRSPRLRRRPILIFVFIVGFVASFAISIIAVSRAPGAAFYLLPTRAWELLAGSIVAVMPSIALTTSRWIRELFCWVGLAAIMIPCLLYSKETPFPGIAALPPCLGTALIIWASSRETSETRNYACRLLAWRPMVFIGLISYSIYLWHWPLFAFGRYLSITPLSSQFSMALVVASFIFAIASWRLVETPYRKRTLGSSRKAMFTWAFSSVAAAVCDHCILAGF